MLSHGNDDNIYSFGDLISKHRGNKYIEERISHEFTTLTHLLIILKIFISSQDNKNLAIREIDKKRAKSVILDKNYSYEAKSIAANVLFYKITEPEYINMLAKLLIEETNGNIKFYESLLRIARKIKPQEQIITDIIFDLFVTYYTEGYKKQNTRLTYNYNNYDIIIEYLEYVDISFIFNKIVPTMKCSEKRLFCDLCLNIIGDIAENSLRSCKKENISVLYPNLLQVQILLESYYDLPIAREKLWNLGHCYVCCELWSNMYLISDPEEHTRIVNQANQLLNQCDIDILNKNYIENAKDKTSMINHLNKITETERILPWKLNVFFSELKKIYEKCDIDQRKYFKQWMAKNIMEQNWAICQKELANLLDSFSSWFDVDITDVDQLVATLNN
jgi:hypothetical protein